MEDKSKINGLIIKSVYVVIIVLIIAVIALLILKYEVEGEQNMPFNLSSILVISSAEGYQDVENEEYKWDAHIYQNNDIYINIEKNKNYKETEIIKSVSIENIQIEKNPIVGNIEFYRMSDEENELFSYKEEYIITNSSVEYEGNIESDLKNLKISNQGGTIIVRAVNKTGKNYLSNENEFEHSGKLLNKVGLTQEEVEAQISFDLVIKLESNISFKAKIELELPTGNIIEEGASNKEIKDTKHIIFKREQA